MKKYLMVGIADSPHLQGLIKNLKKRDSSCIIDMIPRKKIKDDIINIDTVYNFKFFQYLEEKKIRGANLVFYTSLLWWWMFRRNKVFYDIVEIHYVGVYYKKVIGLLKANAKRVSAILWGSDIFRLKEIHFPIMKKILLQCDSINCTTEDMRSQVEEVVGKDFNKLKITMCRLGLEFLNVIQTLAKRNLAKTDLAMRLGVTLPAENMKVVTIGYNGSVGQQHIKIIESFKDKEYRDTLFLVPMTYGASDDYITRVQSQMDLLGVNYKIFTDYMVEGDIAALRLVTDIFIQLQTTDALSGAMQEHMYANNVVITGSWLPYDSLRNIGVVFDTVETVEEIGSVLSDTLLHFDNERERFCNNSSKIWGFSSWESRIEEWEKL